jgi:hydroxyacylglutathione hydrolase
MGRIVEANRGPLVTDRSVPRHLGAEEAVRLLDGGAVALDVRSPETYLAEHLPGSIHVALDGTQFGTRVGFVVPADASLILVVDGEAQAMRAADSLRVVAYDDVLGFLTVPAWRTAGKQTVMTAVMSPESLWSALQHGSSVHVLDVREPDEWEVGHIEGATFMPYREIESRLDELPDDVPLAVVCDAGQRSVIAASLLERAGLRDVVNVDRGMTGWRSVGLPTTTEDREAAESAVP